jgi:site-specific DNA-methyltransferase (adenine-specific)
VLQELPHESVEAIIVDLPYGANQGFDNDATPQDAWVFAEKSIRNSWEKVKSGGVLYAMCDYRISPRLQLLLEDMGIFIMRIDWCYRRTQANPKTWVRSKQDIYFASKGPSAYWSSPRCSSSDITVAVWGRHADPDGIVRDKSKLQKSNIGGTGVGGRTSCDSTSAPMRDWWDDIPFVNGWVEGGKQHPSQKPLKLMQRMIGASCPPDGVVMDYCCGSGGTLVAAELLGRRGIGIEISPEYFDIACRRVEAAVKQREAEQAQLSLTV